ncbi:MAG: HEAT repeat domain-containing protein [Chloroflexota bacterium]
MELEEKEKQRSLKIMINQQDSAPVIEDLAKLGITVEWISDLNKNLNNHIKAIPILLKWLPLIDNLDVKESIVRTLSIPSTKPIAAPALIKEFRKFRNLPDSGIAWVIGNALSVVADDSVAVDIIELVQDLHYGKSRQMLVIALGNMRKVDVQDVLINLLNDEFVFGHAIIALGKIKSKKAYEILSEYEHYPVAWVRKEAKKARGRIRTKQ